MVYGLAADLVWQLLTVSSLHGKNSKRSAASTMVFVLKGWWIEKWTYLSRDKLSQAVAWDFKCLYSIVNLLISQALFLRWFLLLPGQW